MAARMRHGREMTEAEILLADTPRGGGSDGGAPWPIAIAPCAFPIDCGMGLQCPATIVRPESEFQELREAAQQVIDSIPDGPDLDTPDMMVALAGLTGTLRELVELDDLRQRKAR